MKQKLFALMSVAALLASCSNDDFLTQKPNEAPKSEGIVFKMVDTATTRGEFTTDEEGNFATSWNAEVDRIGIIYSGVVKGLATDITTADATIWNDVAAATKTANTPTFEIGYDGANDLYAIYKTTRSGSYGWVTAVDDNNVLKFANQAASPANQKKGSFRAIRPVNNTNVTYSTNDQSVATMTVLPGDFTTQNQVGKKANFDNFFMVADPIDNIYSSTNAVGEELTLSFQRPYAALAVRTVGYNNAVYGNLKSVTVTAATSNLSSTNSSVDVAKKVDGAWVVTPGAGALNSVKLNINGGVGINWSDNAYAFIQILPVDRSEMPIAETYTVDLEFVNGTIRFNKSTTNSWSANSFVKMTCNLDEQDYLYLATNNTLIINNALPRLNGANQFDGGVAANSVTNFISKIVLSSEQLAVVKNKYTGVTDLTLANQSADLGDDLANVYSGARLASLTLTEATVAPKLSGTGTSVALATLSCPKVTEVPAYAYQNNGVLNNVYLPVVETIGNYAFSRASRLTTIGCNAQALKIGYMTYSPTVKHSSLTTIGSFAFEGINIITIDAPEVTTMGARAFGSAAINSLTTVLLPKYDFSDTYNAIALLSGSRLATADLSAVEELGVTTIAFTGTALNTVTLKPGVKIGLSAFANCTGLSRVDNLYQAAEIGENAFRGCTALTDVKVNAATIGVNAFNNSGLTNVVIGSGVTTIADGAFNGCTALNTVSNLANISSIGKEAFKGTLIPAFDFTSATLGEAAFMNCALLKGTVRSNVTTLEKDVFNGALLADRFVFPNVTTIKSGALNGVSAATFATVTFGQALTSIEKDAFCAALTVVPGVNDGSAVNKPITGTAAFHLILADKTGLVVSGNNVTFLATDGKYYQITFNSVQ